MGSTPTLARPVLVALVVVVRQLCPNKPQQFDHGAESGSRWREIECRPGRIGSPSPPAHPWPQRCTRARRHHTEAGRSAVNQQRAVRRELDARLTAWTARIRDRAPPRTTSASAPTRIGTCTPAQHRTEQAGQRLKKRSERFPMLPVHDANAVLRRFERHGHIACVRSVHHRLSQQDTPHKDAT